MSPAPETRETLIQRLPNGADAEAWQAFMEIYAPLLFRLARGRGMQAADAEDFVQEVLAAVAKSVDRWLDVQERGPFRAWLFRIASNLAVNFLTRAKHRQWATAPDFLQQLAVTADDSSVLLRNEYRRELFRWAAERVRGQVSPRQWTAFWRTSVEERPVVEVAAELGLSAGGVYIARCRVTRRIRDLIRQHEEQTS